LQSAEIAVGTCVRALYRTGQTKLSANDDNPKK